MLYRADRKMEANATVGPGYSTSQNNIASYNPLQAYFFQIRCLFQSTPYFLFTENNAFVGILFPSDKHFLGGCRIVPF